MKTQAAAARILIVTALCAWGVFVAGATASDEPAPRPNIVYILADDLECADVGFHAEATDPDPIRTPHLDRLAASGTRLEQFYVQSLCSPTRAALMTGKYPLRLGLHVGVIG